MDIRTEILLKLKINDFIYLVRYKLLNKFISNMIKYQRSYTKFQKTYSVYDLSWGKTKEGCEFWLNIANEISLTIAIERSNKTIVLTRIDEKLFHYLISYNLLSLFITYTKAYQKDKSNIPKKIDISNAFSWNETKEGWDFWNCIKHQQTSFITF